MNRILEIISGSHLYGTNTPTSDKDYVGVCIPDYIDYLLTPEYIKEYDLSIKTTSDKEKNDKNDIDRKFYTYRNFITLVTGNNPNLLEILFVNPENIVFINDVGQRLLDNRDLFLHRGLVARFLGYAEQQSHKMQIKTDKYNEMQHILKFLETLPPKTVLAELTRNDDFNKVMEECQTMEIKQDQTLKKVVRLHDDFLTIGDINIPVNVYVKNAIKRLKDRLSIASNRTELISKYGYDCKFGMHLIRLLFECIEFLKYGHVTFPLKERNLLLDIRNGKYTAQHVLEIKDELKKEIQSLEIITQLPQEARIQDINKFMEQEMDSWVEQYALRIVERR